VGGQRTGGRLPLFGMVVAVWASLPPYIGPALRPLEVRKEIADHVVPAVVLFTLSVAALALRRRRLPGMGLLVAGLTVTLAGIWMTATHVPLVAQAMRHQVSSTVAAWHSAPGVAVLALGLAWTAIHWADAGP